MAEITEDEKKNGWTAESLAKYVAEREKAQAETVMNRKQQKPKYANNRYRPLKWL